MVWVLACVGVCVVRPFPGGRHSHAARRAGRDRGASGARAFGAGMRLTADTKRKPCNYKVHRIRRFNDTSWARPRFAAQLDQCDFRWKIWFWLFCWWP